MTIYSGIVLFKSTIFFHCRRDMLDDIQNFFSIGKVNINIRQFESRRKLVRSYRGVEQ